MDDRARKMRAVSFLLTFLLMALVVRAHQTQSGQDESKRDLWDGNLLNKRPAGKVNRLARTQDDALVGITLWRLRPSVSSDNPGVRSLIHEAQQTSEWTPERILADSLLHEGDKIRISIETARTGYLYVIDTDQYEDGSQSDSYLIFPTLSIRSGFNYVVGGTVIELPAPDDRPPYFKMRRSRPDQKAELITILVSPRRIEHLQIGPQRLKISPDQVALWKKEWEKTSYRLEANEQAGKPYTLAEKSAATGEKKLTQDDPLPQTIYHVDTRLGEPLLIELPLHVSN